MKNQKRRFVVFEGADSTGKTGCVEALIKNFGEIFEEVDFLWAKNKIVHLDHEEKMPLLLNTFKYFDPSKIYVLDRFILSDIVYNHVLRRWDITGYAAHLQRFCEENDVLFIKLGTEKINGPGFSDDKINLSKAEFNSLLDHYKEVPVPTWCWNRRVVFDGQRDKRAIDRLINDIWFALVSDEPLQSRYTRSPWRFFLSCVALNNTQGWAARRVMPEFFWHYKDPYSFTPSTSSNEIMNMLLPLGLQNQRARSFFRLTEEFRSSPKMISSNYIFSSKEIMDLPGLGKYAADSYRAFVLDDKELSHYTPPIDKVVLARILGER